MQNGHPRVTSNACQLVFKYILLNKANLAKAWRTRLYYYSSGTLFQDVTPELVHWLDDNGDGDISLKKLRNDNGLYKVLSNALFDFFKGKPATFPEACLSRQHFWKVPSWKRALTFVSMVRFVFDMPAQKSWNKFDIRDHKFNIRMFNRFIEKETELFSTSTKLKALPAKTEDDSNKLGKRPRQFTSMSEDTDSPVKRAFIVSLVTTSEEESADDEDNDDDEENVEENNDEDEENVEGDNGDEEEDNDEGDAKDDGKGDGDDDKKDVDEE